MSGSIGKWLNGLMLIVLSNGAWAGDPCVDTPLEQQQEQLKAATQKLGAIPWTSGMLAAEQPPLAAQPEEPAKPTDSGIRFALLMGASAEGRVPAALLVHQTANYRMHWPYAGPVEETAGEDRRGPALHGTMSVGEKEPFTNSDIFSLATLPLPCLKQVDDNLVDRLRYEASVLLFPLQDVTSTQAFVDLTAKVCPTDVGVGSEQCGWVHMDALKAIEYTDSEFWGLVEGLHPKERPRIEVNEVSGVDGSNDKRFSVRFEKPDVPPDALAYFYPARTKNVRPYKQVQLPVYDQKNVSIEQTFSGDVRRDSGDSLGILRVVTQSGDKSYTVTLPKAKKQEPGKSGPQQPSNEEWYRWLMLLASAIFASVAVLVLVQKIRERGGPPLQRESTPRPKGNEVLSQPDPPPPEDPQSSSTPSDGDLGGPQYEETPPSEPWSDFSAPSSESDGPAQPLVSPEEIEIEEVTESVPRPVPAGELPPTSKPASHLATPPTPPIAEQSPAQEPSPVAGTPPVSKPDPESQPEPGPPPVEHTPLAPVEDTEAEVHVHEMTDEQRAQVAALHDAGAAGSVAALLAEVLYKHGPTWSMSMRDDRLRRQFDEWLNSSLIFTVRNYEQQEDATIVKKWVEPEVIPALDKLAHFASLLAAEVHGGHVDAEETLGDWYDLLFESLSEACGEAGWFTLQTVKPFEDDFDADHHRAAGRNEVVEGASGKVIRIVHLGRIGPDGKIASDTAVISGV